MEGLWPSRLSDQHLAGNQRGVHANLGGQRHGLQCLDWGWLTTFTLYWKTQAHPSHMECGHRQCPSLVQSRLGQAWKLRYFVPPVPLSQQIPEKRTAGCSFNDTLSGKKKKKKKDHQTCGSNNHEINTRPSTWYLRPSMTPLSWPCWSCLIPPTPAWQMESYLLFLE